MQSNIKTQSSRLKPPAPRFRGCTVMRDRMRVQGMGWVGAEDGGRGRERDESKGEGQGGGL
jgi:hypothetical protein